MQYSDFMNRLKQKKHVINFEKSYVRNTLQIMGLTVFSLDLQGLLVRNRSFNLMLWTFLSVGLIALQKYTKVKCLGNICQKIVMFSTFSVCN